MRILKSRYLRGIRPTSLPPQYQHDVHWHVDSIAILRRGLKLCQRPTARIFNVQSTTRFYGPKGSEFLIPSLKKKIFWIKRKFVLPPASTTFFWKEQFSFLSTFVWIERSENYLFQTYAGLTGETTRYRLIQICFLTNTYFSWNFFLVLNQILILPGTHSFKNFECWV